MFIDSKMYAAVQYKVCGFTVQSMRLYNARYAAVMYNVAGCIL